MNFFFLIEFFFFKFFFFFFLILFFKKKKKKKKIQNEKLTVAVKLMDANLWQVSFSMGMEYTWQFMGSGMEIYTW